MLKPSRKTNINLNTHLLYYEHIINVVCHYSEYRLSYCYGFHKTLEIFL